MVAQAIRREKRFSATATGLNAVTVDKVVEARRTSCPGPIFTARKGLVDVIVGTVMMGLATDSGTQRDFPTQSKNHLTK